MCLAQNGTQDLRIQVARMDRHSYQKIATLEMDMTAALAHLTKATLFESHNDLARSKHR